MDDIKEPSEATSADSQAASECNLEDISNIPRSAIDTQEALPSTQFYRSFAMKRANPRDIRYGEQATIDQNEVGEKKKGGNFGTFEGVFLRCCLNILSVVYYLRFGWIVGNLGLGLTIVLILMCSLTTFLTALSLSALATNGTVKGGGVYYFISRSLGADFGGTIGVVFSFATTFSSVLNAYGFIEVFRDLLGKNITPDGKFDIPVIGISLITLLLITVCISLAWEFYLQYFLAVLIAISFIGIFFGFTIPGNPKWTVQNIKDNFKPQYQEGNTFWSIFAVFFPSCTGIMAGANISGDLKDPQKSIPVGTISAIGFTTILYIITAIILASAGTRERLQTDSQILPDVAMWKYLIYIGVFASSISSSSGGLVGGPKIFQALCKDDLLPRIFRFFAKGKKGSGDPIRGFCLGWLIVVVCTFIFKDLNAVSTALTNFFLISYALVCQSCLVGRMSHSPSWRPAWKYYHPITATLGAAMCIAGMFLINWIFALCVIAISVLLFMYFHWSERSKNNWGEFPQSLIFTNTIKNMEKLKDVPEHVKTYRPQIEFVINYNFPNIESQIRNLAPFNQIITQARSLLLISEVGDEIPDETPSEILGNFIKKYGKIDLPLCARLIAEAGSIGKVGPNILALPFEPQMRNHTNIFDMVGAALDSNLGVAISRGFETFDPNLEHRWPIDVWWLSDDGGLIILFAYLLSNHQCWKNCELRVFTVTSSENITEAQMKMTKLLSLFRIKAYVTVLSGLDLPPSELSMSHWREFNVETKDDLSSKKINSFLRLRELMLQHSGHSSMVLCTMLIPRATSDPHVWLSLLDVVSDAMPPFIWVHGNNENVVTFIA
ncbi:Amino acid permease family protein [Tritrichomonas foetus]|uniref:Amino acid permease family protein n=1 Tax=Tritrichomonas foetus TaxID=1144522 RepID=A0A1J4J704_9EUKA|nr:Amino acid permease family protein [Tritrichomonas foetus]|eukprot:OHS93983.1 Amino acid permease family protein [Tritrichomonas foetus]